MERIAPVMFDAAAIEMLVKHVDETVRGLGIITDGIDSAAEKGVRLLVVCEFLIFVLNQPVTRYFLFETEVCNIHVAINWKHVAVILISCTGKYIVLFLQALSSVYPHYFKTEETFELLLSFLKHDDEAVGKFLCWQFMFFGGFLYE